MSLLQSSQYWIMAETLKTQQKVPRPAAATNDRSGHERLMFSGFGNPRRAGMGKHFCTFAGPYFI
jgi:hypothetical protein